MFPMLLPVTARDVERDIADSLNSSSFIPFGVAVRAPEKKRVITLLAQGGPVSRTPVVRDANANDSSSVSEALRQSNGCNRPLCHSSIDDHDGIFLFCAKSNQAHSRVYDQETHNHETRPVYQSAACSNRLANETLQRKSRRFQQPLAS